MVAAQLASLASSVEPPVGEVIKHTFRYVVFTYLTCIALVINFIRSRKRLRTAFVILTVFGVIFALDGLRSVIRLDGGLSFSRAMPLPILEMIPLGGNQHALAEVMLIGICAALAFGAMSKFQDQKLLANGSAALMAGVAILTFSRTAWIALAVMVGILSITVWKDWLLARKQWVIVAAILFIPIAAAMGVYNLNTTSQQSVDSRSMLTSIAVDAFNTSPVLGIGAGTFYDRVSRTYAFVVEFGPAFDAHGFIQKTLAETGLIGLFALIVTVSMILREMWKTWNALSRGRIEREAYAYLAVGVIGSFIYQLFSTSYWTPRLWLPVGIMLAAGRIFLEKEADRDPDFLRR
jgi:O-antigen ligase